MNLPQEEIHIADKDLIDVQANNSSVMLARISDIYEKGFMTDVCLIVNGKEYPCHRLILCSSSNVFHVMLMSPMWSESSESRIVLQESAACSRVFGSFLQYLYSAKIHINQGNVMAILSLADKYDVKDLVKHCIEYMCSHIAHAAVHNQLVSWMQYTLACGHLEVAAACKKFVKWNIELISDTDDFGNLEPDLFISLLQQNDLVVVNELRLYKIAVRWLKIQKDNLASQSGTTEQDLAAINRHLEKLTIAVMSNIRFPMMSPRQLAELLLSDLVKRYKEFFMEQMAIGMAFHADEQPDWRLQAALSTQHGRFWFTPRLYTADTYSTQLTIENLSSLPAFHTRTLVFSSLVGNRNHRDHICQERGDQCVEWVVEVYPKGVWFRKFWLIVWQGTVEVPEHILRSVRVSVSCRSNNCLRVRVGLLIIGQQDNIEHVVHVIERHHQFDDRNQILNFDDVVDFDELNTPAAAATQDESPSRCPYLVGPVYDSFKLHIVIAPMGDYSTVLSPPFGSSDKW